MVLISEYNPAKPKGKTLKTCELRPRKGVKPLSNHIFYLDIKNHKLSTKIEAKIKQFGGDVSLFLVDEVTHVITDNLTSAVNSSSNLQATQSSSFCSSNNSLESSLSPCVSKEPTSTSGRRKSGPRSRADAMLERAQCNRNTCHSPVQVAHSRDIPVWNVDKILKYLNKITSTPIFDGKLNTNIECTKLLGPHLKVESLKEDFRPSYKYFRTWPVLNILGEFGACPFKIARNCFDNSMHGKTADSVDEDIKFSDIEQPADNYKPSLTYCMELKKMARKTRQRTRRKESQSPQCGYCEICHLDYPDLSGHLQSGLHQNYVSQESNFVSLDKLIQSEASVESFLESNCSLNISKRCLRSQDIKNSCDESLNQSVLISESNSDIFNKMSDAKCINHNKRCLRSMFKPHDLNLKNSYSDSLDQSEPILGSNTNKRCLRSQDFNNLKNLCDHNDIYNKSKEKNTISDGRLRPRVQSNILNYFEAAETTCNSLKSKNSKLDNMKQVIPISPSYKIVGAKSKVKEQESKSDKNSGLVVKFKRIRQSELLVLSDEAENFMFPKRDDSSESESELSNSRGNCSDKIKFNESAYDKMICDNSDSDTTNEDNLKLSEIRNKQRFPLNPTQPHTSVGDGVGLIDNKFIAEDIEELKFSFECTNNDLWCHTYKRKDENKEMRFESYKIGITNRNFKLPYEMGPLPPLKPNCCKLNVWSDAMIPEKKIKKRKRQLVLANGKSRKSPREHASTLASMVQQRQKEELNALAVIKEESCSTEMSEISDSIQQLDVLLSNTCDDKIFIDVDDILEGIPINVKYEPSIGNLLETLDESKILKDIEDQNILFLDDQNGDDQANRKDIGSKDISKLMFSFECTPNELWYHTYKRKDENKELTFLNAKSKSFSRTYKLPYELGPLPPLKPNCCKLNTSNVNSSVVKRKMKKRKRGILLSNRKCRKSPREHASILASFVKLHKKQEINIDNPKSNESIETENKTDTSKDIQHLDLFLSNLYNDKTCFDVKDILDEGVSLNVRYEPTVNNLLETLDESTVLEDLKFQTQVKHDRRKKRKKNRTGWPKKKKFLSRSNSNKHQKDSFVNAATQTNTCELTNNEIVLSIPVTDDSVNIVELSSEPLVVCGDHSCSSGKENILCENSDIFVECMIKTGNSINSDNEQENASIDVQQNISDVAKVTLSKCNVNKIVNNSVCTVDDASVVSDDRRFQPYVCVHKMDDPHNSKHLQVADTKRKKINSNKSVPPICTLSPRKLRAPRGKWYRER